MSKQTKTINLTGSQGKSYDLDQIEKQSRLNQDMELIVHVHKYNPDSNDKEKISPNPKNPKTGQIWLSKIDKSIV